MCTVWVYKCALNCIARLQRRQRQREKKRWTIKSRRKVAFGTKECTCVCECVWDTVCVCCVHYAYRKMCVIRIPFFALWSHTNASLHLSSAVILHFIAYFHFYYLTMFLLVCVFFSCSLHFVAPLRCENELAAAFIDILLFGDVYFQENGTQLLPSLPLSSSCDSFSLATTKNDINI